MRHKLVLNAYWLRFSTPSEVANPSLALNCRLLGRTSAARQADSSGVEKTGAV